MADNSYQFQLYRYKIFVLFEQYVYQKQQQKILRKV